MRISLIVMGIDHDDVVGVRSTFKSDDALSSTFDRLTDTHHHRTIQQAGPLAPLPIEIESNQPILSVSHMLLLPLLLFVLATATPGASAQHHKPQPSDLARTSRWLMHESTWGVLSTLSTTTGAPFGTRSRCRMSPGSRKAYIHNLLTSHLPPSPTRNLKAILSRLLTARTGAAFSGTTARGYPTSM